jgi:hypothetical protein
MKLKRSHTTLALKRETQYYDANKLASDSYKIRYDVHQFVILAMTSVTLSLWITELALHLVIR